MEIKTQRLLLREFEEDDWCSILEYHSRPEYLRYHPWSERTEEDARNYVGRYLSWRDENPRSKYHLAITSLANRQLIGSCGVRIIDSETGEGEFDIELNPYYWHKGYAVEASQRMVAFAFQDLDLRRLSAKCIAENTSVRRLLEKLGMHKESELRHDQQFKGRWWNSILYGLLKEEWLQTYSSLWHLYVDR